MDKVDFWDEFEKSGKIEDYLKYKDNIEKVADRESEPIGNP